MRLLQYNNDGELSLTKDFVGGEIPEYAILSHTWGKVGYEKIRFCGRQARRDDLHNFWVDTCCINKSSDRELSEAMSSMFRWYRKAAKCYVYLTDVSINDRIDLSLQPWEAACGNSRWFTRGWTLQELIAPPSVDFFCSNGNRLGDKKSLEGQLHKIHPLQPHQTPLHPLQIRSPLQRSLNCNVPRPGLQLTIIILPRQFPLLEKCI
ncbi:HET-domain-containing protein [Cadophora sp. DSE1049]|nr:HET-domain-containing protein [Cadophora sp. DSE1049]